MGLGGFLKKVLKFEKSHFKTLWKGLKDDPKRLFLGVDPLSTKMWNKILGRDDRALVNQLGGATSYDYQKALEEGIDIGPGKQVQDVAGMIAGVVGGGAAASGLGAAAGSVSGAAIAPATQTAIGAATKVGTAYAAGLDEPGDDLTEVVRGFNSGPGEQLGQAQNLLRSFQRLDDPYTYGLSGMEHMFVQSPKGKAEGGRVPSKSPAQAKLMRAVAHGWKKPGGGPSRSVAREFVAADKKAKGYGIGGKITEGIAELKARQEDPVAFYEKRYGTEPLTFDQLKKKGPGKGSFLGAIPAYQDLMTAGWTPGVGGETGGGDLWFPPQPTIAGGLEDATRVGGYAVPQASTRTGTDFDPGSIAEEIYNKYGIIDPTWTNYDRTSQEAMREDPLAHLPAGDPARAEYEGWNQQREKEEGLREMIAYPEMMGKQSPQREQLRQHKARVSDILSGGGGGDNVVAGGTPGFYTEAPELLEEEPVEMQFGGLAQMARRGIGSAREQMGRQRGSMGGRGSPQMMQAMQRQTGRAGPQRAQRGMAQRQMAQGRGRGRGPQRQMMQQMAQRRGMGRGRGRGSPGPMGGRGGPGFGGMREMVQRAQAQRGPGRGMPQRGPMKSLGRPGMGGGVQPGGPGGMPGGRPEMISPGDARMPGGRAMPLRGFQQKQAMQRRGNLGGNRVGPADQQGGLSRAMQKQTGRPPISRRMGFPGRAR
jgi:hypothetical protein